MRLTRAAVALAQGMPGDWLSEATPTPARNVPKESPRGSLPPAVSHTPTSCLFTPQAP